MLHHRSTVCCIDRGTGFKPLPAPPPPGTGANTPHGACQVPDCDPFGLSNGLLGRGILAGSELPHWEGWHLLLYQGLWLDSRNSCRILACGAALEQYGLWCCTGTVLSQCSTAPVQYCPLVCCHALAARHRGPRPPAGGACTAPGPVTGHWVLRALSAPGLWQNGPVCLPGCRAG